jgi:hypothetical protein
MNVAVKATRKEMGPLLGLGLMLFSFFAMGDYDPSRSSSAPSREKLKDYAASEARPNLRQFIRVSCIVKQPELEQLRIPCPPLTFHLLDNDGKQIRKILSQYGEIKVRVEKKRSFFLSLDSTQYRLPSEKVGPFLAGETGVVQIEPLEPK